MKKILLLPGDGIGKEVSRIILKLVNALHLDISIVEDEVGWECWKKYGTPIKETTWEKIKEVDAILLGAITSKPEREAIQELQEGLKKHRQNLPTYVSPVIQLRQRLDLYANVRPIHIYDRNIELCIIRENSEGLYCGLDFYPTPPKIHDLIKEKEPWKDSSSDEFAASIRVLSKDGLERLFRFAFKYALANGYEKVTYADKPNVLRRSGAFGREILEDISQDYPTITCDIQNVDAVALWMIKRPEKFGVIVAENMFGDILSDLGAGLMGGLGLAYSGNFGGSIPYFEPVHGSAPNMQPNRANPMAMTNSFSYMLSYLGCHKEASLINKVIREMLADEKSLTYDLGGGRSAEEVIEQIIKTLEFYSADA